MTTDKPLPVWRGWLSLMTMPLWILFAFGLYVPFLVARKIWRWYRLPQHRRDAINANQRVAIEHGWDRVETLVQAELAAHQLLDTPENRVRLNSSRARRKG